MTDAIQQLDILSLRPNNWYLNRAKLDRVREAWRNETQNDLPPVLVSIIDNTWALIDGHSRVFAAYENNASTIAADVQPLDAIEGSRALYEHIHRTGPQRGIRTISNLRDRILDPAEHRRLWVGYCQEWLAKNKAAED